MGSAKRDSSVFDPVLDSEALAVSPVQPEDEDHGNDDQSDAKSDGDGWLLIECVADSHRLFPLCDPPDQNDDP